MAQQLDFAPRSTTRPNRFSDLDLKILFNGASYEAPGCGQWRGYASRAVARPGLATVHQTTLALSWIAASKQRLIVQFAKISAIILA
ncbi:MAG TPA: hypothetical protein VLM79_07065 [Kofleriaceae bacterium]|nr:hypothetical protein [Kofleriaceae bacterium]